MVPSSVLSTYAVNCSEVISVGPDRVVVAAGAESRVQQLSSGVMQRLALYEPPWEAAYREQYEMDYYGGAGYTLPPYQDQYAQPPYGDNRAPQQQQYRQQQQQQPEMRQAQQRVREPRERRVQQQSYDDFIEAQEPEPVYEAQVDYPKYNKDEDRL